MLSLNLSIPKLSVNMSVTAQTFMTIDNSPTKIWQRPPKFWHQFTVKTSQTMLVFCGWMRMARRLQSIDRHGDHFFLRQRRMDLSQLLPLALSNLYEILIGFSFPSFASSYGSELSSCPSSVTWGKHRRGRSTSWGYEDLVGWTKSKPVRTNFLARQNH